MWRAPCGHEGEPVIGAYVNCRVPGCDGTPGKCPHCSSPEVEPFRHPQFPDGTLHCWRCSRVWHPGVATDDGA